MRALIIGWGRAGRRHHDLLLEHHPRIEVKTYDPYVFGEDQWYSLEEVLNNEWYDFAVICSPPALHIEQIKLCHEYRVAVLCEKPLADLGQSSEAEELLHIKPIMKMAYNYRHHPDLWQLYLEEEAHRFFYSSQKRTNLPNWGLLVDHVSHTVDMLHWNLDVADFSSIQVGRVQYKKENKSEQWRLWGTVGLSTFDIVEKIITDKEAEVKKSAFILGSFGRIDVESSDEMWIDMYEEFLDFLRLGKCERREIEQALSVQFILEQVMEKIQ